MRAASRALVTLCLIFPFLYLIARYHLTYHADWGEIRWAAGNTALQAAGSATVAILLGLAGASGLLCFTGDQRKPWRLILETCLLLPNFFPVLFLLLACLNLFDPFPMGLRGIVIVHALMNWGLVAVLVASLIERKLGHLAELSLVEGAGRAEFLVRGLLPMIGKELSLLWLFVFTVSFGSFAVPLMVGGARGTTLEVLVYEKIRLQADWSEAVLIAVLQSGLLFVLGWFAGGRSAVGARVVGGKMHFARSRAGIYLIVALTGLLFFGYLQGLPAGWREGHEFRGWLGDLAWGLAGSLRVGFVTAALSLVLLMLTAWASPSRPFEKFLAGYVAPSSALTAFAFLVLSPNEDFWPYLKIPAALTLITFPGLWRLGWQGGLEQLRRQREVARSLGAGHAFFFRFVAWPQLAGLAGTLAGLAAVWACGDFAVSRILAHRDLTLGLMTESLITSGYRLGLATTLSFGVALSAVICFFCVKGAVRVLGRTPQL